MRHIGDKIILVQEQPSDTDIRDRDNKYSPTFYQHLICNYVFMARLVSLQWLAVTRCDVVMSLVESCIHNPLGNLAKGKPPHYKLTPSNLDVIIVVVSPCPAPTGVRNSFLSFLPSTSVFTYISMKLCCSIQHSFRRINLWIATGMIIII